MVWKKVISGMILFGTGVGTGILAAAQFGLAETSYNLVVEDPRGNEIKRYQLDGEDDTVGEIPTE